MQYDFSNLRIQNKGPVYPPYHEGLYLEEYFYNFYLNNKDRFDKTGFTLIPIFWTAVYNQNVFFTAQNDSKHLIQEYINALPGGKYFCVSQHDDAVKEILPKNTLSFEAGGNKNGIPIPLICSPIKQIPEHNKEYFCSFVGCFTHHIRNEIFNNFNSDNDFKFVTSQWESTVSSDKFDNFVTTTSKSEFSLCPRGYGPSSFRLYEILQLNSIPVYIYDKAWLPFEKYLNWSDFCVLVEQKDIKDLKTILKSISPEKKENMLKTGKEVYKNFFTLEKTSEQILKMLEDYE